MRELLAHKRQRATTEPFHTHTFQYNNQTYEIESEDVKDERDRTTGRQWLVKVNGVIEHTLRVLPNDDRESLEQRTIHAVDHTGAGALRDWDFTFQETRYHLEDWSNKLSQSAARNFAMWCVTRNGVIEGTFAAPRNETESMLHDRAIDIVRRSREFNGVKEGLATEKKPRSVRRFVTDAPSQDRSLMMLVWVLLGLVTASVVSSLVQSMLFPAP